MRWLVVIALTACYSPPSIDCAVRCGIGNACPDGLDCNADGFCSASAATCTPADSAIDAADDAIPGNCMGVNERPFFPICTPAGLAVMSTWPVSGSVSTTSGSADCMFEQAQPPTGTSTSGTPACVIIADDLSVENVRVLGTRPLVLVGRTSLVVTGTIDAAGRNTEITDSLALVSPNANTCVSNFGDPGGGGAGASHNGLGGTGGPGPNAPKPPNAAVIDPIVLRGGCRGGDGGLTSSAGGIGGNGGGAVYLLSPALTINGTINASGGGARSLSGNGSGGGGGGSGGMILLWSTAQITFGADAQVFALGGGGGNGASATGTGLPGNDPTGTTTSAAMQPGLNGGGSGGFGGFNDNHDGQAGGQGFNGGGGGGGGGAVGHIRLLPKDPAVTTENVSPLPD